MTMLKQNRAENENQEFPFSDLQRTTILSTQQKWRKSRIGLLELRREDAEKFLNALDGYNYLRNMSGELDEIELSTLAKVIALHLKTYSQQLDILMEKAKKGKIDVIYVTGLPTSCHLFTLIVLALSYKLGYPISFNQSKGYSLVHLKQFKDTGSRSSDKLLYGVKNIYSLYAEMPKECRPEWKCYFGIRNPTGYELQYAPILEAFDKLSIKSRYALATQKISFPVPRMPGHKKDHYISHGPILDISVNGDIEVTLPRSMSHIHSIESFGLTAPLNELRSIISKRVKRFSLKPGSFLAFNNLRGLHVKNHKLADDLVMLQTSVIQSLQTLQFISKETGPVFDPHKIIEQHIIRD